MIVPIFDISIIENDKSCLISKRKNGLFEYLVVKMSVNVARKNDEIKWNVEI
jgi:hypothetical protein